MNIERILIALCLIGFLAQGVFLLGATTARSEKQCKRYAITSTASDYYIPLDGRYVVIEYENDTTGDSSGTESDLYTCEDRDSNNDGTDDSNACKEHYWDSDYDGAPDTNRFTGESWPSQKRRAFVAAKDIFIDTVAYVSPASFSVCPRRIVQD